ncbi:MAG: TPM domain-containing protein [Pirellulaceae bacterium]
MAAGKRKTVGNLLLAALLAMLASSAVGAREIPPVPAIDGSGEFVHDLAGVLYVQNVPQGHHKTIYDAQQVAFEEHDTPIIVVTIHRMAAYGYAGQDIQPFAEEWFNKWQIGTLNKSAGGHNRGILLMVSVGDRKGRIELGADWGRRFDGACQQIMDNVMIPHFKRGDYAAGIAAGTEALGKLAAAGPEGTVSDFGGRSGGSGQRYRGRRSGISSFSWFPWWGVLLGCGLGVVLIYFGARPQRYRDLEGKKYVEATSMTLVYIGAAVIVVSVVTPLLYLILIFLLMLAGKGDKTWGETLFSGDGGGSGGWGGGSFGGGGFSGGSSGGGGASGSW